MNNHSLYKHKWFCLFISSMLVLLAACGNTNSSGTKTGGPVSIATDHSTYQPTNSIQVTVTNTLTTPIYALDTAASCSILDLQVQINGAWSYANAAPCPLGRRAMTVKIDAGKPYSATISAGMPGSQQGSFPAGTYRLVLKYSTSAEGISSSSTTTLYSETFNVAG